MTVLTSSVWTTRLCALILAGYCAATAVLYKRFWAPGDFWSEPDGKGRALFWDFS
jgi:putative oxidoreductase